MTDIDDGYEFPDPYQHAPTETTSDQAVDVEYERRLARMWSLLHNRSQLKEIPPPSWLIEDVLGDATLAWLSGKFGTYKSFVAVGWACSVATGRDWFGRKVRRTGPVVIIAAEGASTIQGRVRAWELAFNGGQEIPADQLFVLSGPMKLNNPLDVRAVLELCDQVKPVLVVWDTLHRCAPGVEENSSTEIGLVYDALSRVKDKCRATQLVLHHTGHGGARARGSSSIEDDGDDSWVIKLGGDGEDRSVQNPRTLVHRKFKDAESAQPIGLKLVVDEEGHARVVERTAVDAADESKFEIESQVLRILAAAGLPRSAGKATCGKTVRATGMSIANDTLRDIVNRRQQTPGQVPLDEP